MSKKEDEKRAWNGRKIREFLTEAGVDVVVARNHLSVLGETLLRSLREFNTSLTTKRKKIGHRGCVLVMSKKANQSILPWNFLPLHCAFVCFFTPFIVVIYFPLGFLLWLSFLALHFSPMYLIIILLSHRLFGVVSSVFSDIQGRKNRNLLRIFFWSVTKNQKVQVRCEFSRGVLPMDQSPNVAKIFFLCAISRVFSAWSYLRDNIWGNGLNLFPGLKFSQKYHAVWINGESAGIMEVLHLWGFLCSYNKISSTEVLQIIYVQLLLATGRDL